MPRQDVPYGGAICRLKERIAEIWDKLGEKLHSINGVEGDAAGDVKIVSGDAAIVVTSDQVNHQIEVALDSSQLPSAAVTSVNAYTGAVVLEASDIWSDGSSDVQTDINDLKTDMNANTSAIAQEVLDRQNADSALQGNINATVASIPGAAATAVANDPTVAQLATDVPNKLDKIVSGSTLKAYTHTGASQGETSIVDGTTANSIGIRDANGRMQAADPASGATDKTLVTANWVSQTGDSGPNNLIHKSGNETKTGIMTFPDRIVGNSHYVTSRIPFDGSRKWYKVATIPNSISYKFSVNMMHEGGTAFGVWDFVGVTWKDDLTRTRIKLSSKTAVGYVDTYDVTTSVCVGYDSVNNKFILYVYAASYCYNNVDFSYIASYGNIQDCDSVILSVIEEDPTSTGYSLVYATL